MNFLRKYQERKSLICTNIVGLSFSDSSEILANLKVKKKKETKSKISFIRTIQ